MHMSHYLAGYPGEDTTQRAHCGLAIHLAKGTRAFTLIETLIASVIVTIAASALYGCLIFNVKHISISREERRSTQILVEMTETLRLYTWEQLHDPTFLPSTFQTTYDPQHPECPGVTYAGSVTVTDFTGPENYATYMATVTISLQWTNHNILRQRDIATIVTKLGLQNYVY